MRIRRGLGIGYRGWEIVLSALISKLWKSLHSTAVLHSFTVVLFLGIAGCAQNSAQNAALGINDPYEGVNRDIHDFNKGADRLIIRPVSQGYEAVTPGILRMMVQNALSHLELPRNFANHLLVGDGLAAGRTLVRFALNTTLGFGGILDPATDVALPKEDADFGKTLATHGVEQGAYFEVPLIGPSSTRHIVGRVVDIAFSPTTYLLSPFSGIARTALGVAEARSENADLIDDVLYGSDDSYALVRSLYLQRRKAFVNGGADFDDAISFDD
jgi:phospholipid-binding lipoprotein MlaA